MGVDYFVLTICEADLAQNAVAGQFFNLGYTNGDVPRLKKPISIYDVDGDRISFMIKKLGKGTEALSKLRAGDEMKVLGPLGNGFPLLVDRNVLLISGGVGYPPMVHLKKELKKCTITHLHGGRTETDIFPCDIAYTEDGSKGETGLVTKDLEKIINEKNINVIYTCGPDPMMHAIGKIAKAMKVECHLSLEEYMACGIGACYGCAVRIKADNEDGFVNKRVCKDGPVFEINELWVAENE